MLKKILFVSYLKNKGIRRICFVLGSISFLFVLGNFFWNYNNFRISQKFMNLDSIRANIAGLREANNYVKADTLYECTNELYEKIGVQTYLLNLYKYDKSMPLYDYCGNNPNDEECLYISQLDNHKVEIDCNKHQHFFILIILFVSFYLFSWLVCLLKFLKNIVSWIYRGFKENS